MGSRWRAKSGNLVPTAGAGPIVLTALEVQAVPRFSSRPCARKLHVGRMSAPNRFQKLVQDAKTRITEIAPNDAAREMERGAMLIDVREKEDWDAARIPGAVHLSRGTIELDIEETAPALDTPIICQCGGGSRSALAAESLQRMGYTNVKSLAGGLRAWKEAGLPVTT